MRGSERPGSIVINVPERRLYLVEGGGRALRYAVGVGRNEALNFHGSAVIGRKEEWPRWTPTANMIAAMPRYRPYAGGMAGGVGNPLGARALYLYRDGHDTYFRVHGTNEPQSIGHAVSSGCIRLFNQDIIDLYKRVPVGTHVTVVTDPIAGQTGAGTCSISWQPTSAPPISWRGFFVGQSSVAKYMVKRHGPPCAQPAPDIAAMDLFVVPTIGFDLLSLPKIPMSRRSAILS